MTQNDNQSILVEVSPGELLDKITILEIKLKKMTDASKLKNVQVELDCLNQAKSNFINTSAEITGLMDKLRDVNQKLWDIEDDIRDHESQKQFGDSFIQLARQVYKTNDVRAALKKEINLLLGSMIVEEKSYKDY